MNYKISKIIDTSGKCLLVWYLYQTYKYIWGGRLIVEITHVSSTFQSGAFFFGVYSLFQIPIATIGAFIIIPLLLRGNIWGLCIGIAYWAMGSLINPFWFVMTDSMQISPDGKATVLLYIANSTWSIITLVILISFYRYRKGSAR